jgi:hypothetical protein
MRRAYSLLVLGLISLTAGPLAAGQVVLKDGRTLETKRPPEIRGRQAVLLLADGTLVSIPASEIDTAKTAAAAAKVAEAAKLPAPTTVVARPPSLVDAANATRDGKKASVVLTDQDVAAGQLDAGGEKKAAGDGRVVVSNVSAKKAASGTMVTGSVQNVGGGPVEGVGVTIELVGDGGKTVASAFGQLSADALAPGEKATFTSQLDTEATAQNVRVMPRWRSRETGGEKSDPGSPVAKATAAKDAIPPAGPTPAPTPAPAATRPPAPRSPDMAAPPANAPVGAPLQPGGGYVPQPSSNQPKPPGGV